MTPRRPRVVFFHRKPVPTGAFSIENLFAEVRGRLAGEFDCAVAESRFLSRGLLPRVYNIAEAAMRQGEVNHVTGDVHFLTMGLRRTRTILTIHDLVPLLYLRGWKRRIARLLWYRIPIRRVSWVTVVSSATRDELTREIGCDPAKVVVVPNFVAPRFAAVPAPPPRERPRILQLGTAWNKNIERLAEALEDVRCDLEIIGVLSDSQRAALDRHRIRYTQSSKLSDGEILRRYADCDLVAFVSVYEGFGLPILEANAVGRPVVTGSTSSMPEVAGKAACIVDPYDVASIRAGFLRVIADHEYRQALVAAGFENVRRFDAGTIAERYAALYRRVLGRAAAQGGSRDFPKVYFDR